MRLHQLFHNVSLRELNLSSRLRKKMKKEIKFKIGEYMLKYRAKTKVNKSYKICKKRKKKLCRQLFLKSPLPFILDFRIKIDKELIMVIPSIINFNYPP